MAFETLFIDGFDHYATVDLGAKYDASVNSAHISVQATTVRTGGKALRLGSSSIGTYLTRSMGMNARTIVAGFAIYITSLPGGSSSFGPLRLVGDGTDQITLNVNTSNQLTLRRGSYSGTILGTSSALPTGQWNYVELRVYIDGTAGEWEIRINGVTEVSGSGVDTKNASVNYANEFWVASIQGTESFRDDFYIRGATDLQAGGFLGDVKVVTVLPQANGTYAQLTPTGAASNFEAVDDATPDGDTTYVSGQSGKDSYDLAPLNITGIIHAAQWNVLAKKSDAGERSLKHFTKSGATEQAGSLVALSTEYRYQSKIYETDPNTGASWTVADLDAAEFGQEIL